MAHIYGEGDRDEAAHSNGNGQNDEPLVIDSTIEKYEKESGH